MVTHADIYDEVAYTYDGSLEGLLSAIFAAYANHANPTEVVPEAMHQPRLGQRVFPVSTNIEHAVRVRKGLISKGGYSAYSAIRRASCSSDPTAGTAAYTFARYVMDVHTGKRSAISNIAHKMVAPINAICRSVGNECEHMRQFIRFEHLKGNGSDFWFAQCNPRDSVVPLIMPHFVERFNIQAFMIYDEVHKVAGVYDGTGWHLVNAADLDESELKLPDKSLEENVMQDAWRAFYQCVAIDARYNPELRRNFMPKRLWKNLTEMKEDANRLALAK